MNKYRKALELGLALCIFALFLNVVPQAVLMWVLAIPGLVFYWLASLFAAWSLLGGGE